ncbi:MAG: HAD-IA family hydrolase [Clostridia bacterium]|nr:HAD-IA family hydrolase [Clostridia bacterium]
MLKYKKKAVVFDLDGTILDTIGDIAAAVNYALDAYGFKPRTKEEIISFIGNGSLMLIRRALGDENGEKYDDNFVKAVRNRFREEYQKHMLDDTYVYEGIIELVDELNEMGIASAVVTNKDDRSAVPMIKHYFGDRFSIVRGVRADIERKPNPELTLSVLNELGVTPSEALFVGDGMADLKVSQNCGIEYIPIGYGYTSPERLFEACQKTPVNDVKSLRETILKCL